MLVVKKNGSVDYCPVRQAVNTTMYHRHADFQPWDMVIARSKQSAEVVQYVGGNFFTENNLSERNHQLKIPRDRFQRD